MASAARNEEIEKAYEFRYGSKIETFKKVNEGKEPKDPSRVSMAEVRKWFLENDVGTLKIQTGFNSFVPPSAKHELQVDGFEFKYKQAKRPGVKKQDVGDGKGEVYDLGRPWARKLAHVNPHGLIAINPFTKKVHVESMLGKIGTLDYVPALQKIVKKLGKPDTIYTDPDATVKGNAVKDWCKENGIVSVITRQHAAVAERAIRMIKKRISDKLKKGGDIKYPDKGTESIWTKHVQEAVDWYNEENVQATTNMKPVEAEKPENEFDVKTNLEINAIHRRKYPVIEVGDEVRTYRKKKMGDKERMGNFEEGIRKVKEITTSLGQKFYKLSGDPTDYPFIRADLHLIKKGKEAEAKAAVPAEVNEERNIDVDEGVREEVKFTPEETKLLEDHKANNLKKMNKDAKAKYAAKKEAQAEAEKIKAELAVAAAAAEEKRKKVVEENRKIDVREANEQKRLAKALKPYRGRRI